MKLFRFYQILGLGAMLMSLPACDGILDGIYDIPRTTNGYGFNPNSDGVTGTLFIDATDYAQWTYINLHTEEIDSTRITDESGTKAERKCRWAKMPRSPKNGISHSTATM